MIIKKQVYRPDRKANPVIGLLLFLISVFLLIVTGPLGFIYGIFHTLFVKGLRGVGEYLLKIAVSIDQLGNVLMQHLLNVLWAKKGRYPFGNRDETISSALGRNKKLIRLTGFGSFIDDFLDLIDPNHSLNSIDYYIEPTEWIEEYLSLILLSQGRILVSKRKEASRYAIPGVRRTGSEPDIQQLFQGIKEDVQLQLHLPTLEFLGIFETRAEVESRGVLVRKTCYLGSFSGLPEPGPDTSQLVWLQYADREMVAEADWPIFDFLHQKGWLP